MSSIRENIDIEDIGALISNKNAYGRANQSGVWKHFEKIINERTNKVDQTKCFYCDKLLMYNITNGTSSMHKHLLSCKKYPHNVDKSQTILSFRSTNKEDERECSTLTNWRFSQEVSRQLLAEMIIVDEEPFTKVEQPGFRKYVSSLQPLWKHISRFTIARDCLKIYNFQKVSLKKQLSSIKSRIALTTDIWTSIQNCSYLCLTAHFIDENWVLHKRILSFVTISSHKGREIGKMVEKCILEWGIEDQVSTLTVDNASANDVAINYLKGRLVDRNALLIEGKYSHMRCTAHIMNLIVKDGLSEVKDSISRIHSSVKYVRSSPSRGLGFEKCVKEEIIIYRGGVCLDVATRWNSTYLMLDAVIKFRKAFKRLEDDDPNFVIDLSNETLSVEDWEKAIIFAKFLKAFYEATKRMSGTKYVTSNNYFDEIVTIVVSLNAWENDSNPCLHSMSKKMREKFDKYYGSLDKVNMMVLIAAVLDPRYKMKYVSFCYKKIFANDLEKAEMMSKVLRDEFEQLFNIYDRIATYAEKELGSSSCPPMGTNQSFDGVDFDDNTNYHPIKNAFLEEMDDGVLDVNKSELELYLEEKCESLKCELNILEWWKVNKGKYKVLSIMAKDVFAIPVSTVASESAFSTSGCVLDKFRSSLSSDVVQALICTQDWLRCAPTPIPFEDYLVDPETYDLVLKAIDDGSILTIANLED